MGVAGGGTPQITKPRVLGTGGQSPPPQNAPGTVSPSPGIQPGQSTGVVTARRVIVFGPEDGVFTFSGTPAAGNLTTSDTGVAGTISGNAYLAGFTVYWNISGTYYALNVNQGLILYSAASPAGPYVGVFPPPSAAGSVGVTAFADVVLAANAVVRLKAATAALVTNANLIAGDPSNPANAETWHTITLDAGWSTGGGYAAPSYRLTPAGELELTGRASFSFTSASGVHLNSGTPLPSFYLPASSHDPRTSDLIGSRCHISVNTAGVLTATPPSGATFPGTYFAEIDSITELTL